MESPEYLRMSLAAALTLGLKNGSFYRGARLYCINLLLTYKKGCYARCAYCGLSGKRRREYREKSFIRVPWPTYPLDLIIERMREREQSIKRICISMITHVKAKEDTKYVCSVIHKSLSIPISLLISPTVLKKEDLYDFKHAGADMIGVAIDLATKELFDRFRGKGIGGPHRWERYWSCLKQSIEIFGEGNAGAHFIVGLEETEREMCKAIQRVKDMGGSTHLFSFYPEGGSLLEDHPPPPMEQYRMIQIARFLIDEGIAREEQFRYGDDGEILDFGIDPALLEDIVNSGRPFMTSGCKGRDGQVACNRPYANERPGDNIRNYPFPPTPSDIQRIWGQLRYVIKGRDKGVQRRSLSN